MADAFAEITSWDSYAPTALHDLPDVAAHLGVRRVVFKDESTRFGLGSFKALGGAYAVRRLVKQTIAERGSAADLVVATATDGNHGRSVSWGAQRAGCAAKIYI
ncbi:MAG TPA: diaminopropionate ammonia-lyase, partial [Alphaproteobacteria bacterium]|nr:diaminopropionate ammonia-lyase [Alphaproteobacteria bacterium]